MTLNVFFNRADYVCRNGLHHPIFAQFFDMDANEFRRRKRAALLQTRFSVAAVSDLSKHIKLTVFSSFALFDRVYLLIMQICYCLPRLNLAPYCAKLECLFLSDMPLIKMSADQNALLIGHVYK
jgi:hypothetical protein